MAGETEHKAEEATGAAQGMTRREAMLQLLRVGGVRRRSGRGCLAQRAQFPACSGAGNRGTARPSRGGKFAMAGDDGSSKR
jgi:hypothetical protein